MLKYEIALINVFWSSNGIDTRYHKNEEEQIAYFLGKANGKFRPVSNFPMGNNISTSIIIKSDKSEDIEQAVASNYAVVRRNIYNENNEIIEQTYRYYFAFCSQDSGNQLYVQLDLDDLQTNYFKYKNLLPEGLVRRCNLDRWVTDTNGNYIFNTGIDSPFYLNESSEIPNLILKNRERLVVFPLNQYGPTPFGLNYEKYKEEIIGWLYCYVSNGEYNANYYPVIGEIEIGVKLVDFKITNSKQIGEYYTSPLDAGVSLVVVPLTKNAEIKFRNSGNNGPFNVKSLEKFLRNDNEGFARVYSLKFSNIPPSIALNLIKIDEDYYFEYDTLVPNDFLTPIVTNENLFVLASTKETESKINSSGFCRVEPKNKLINTNVEEIKLQSNNYLFNPKIYNEFIKYKLKTGDGNEKEISLLELGYFSNYLDFQYFESLSPDITRYYLTPNFATIKNSIYSELNQESLYGLVGSIDNSIPVANNQLDQMLAQNKNFYLSSVLNIANNFVPNVGGIKGKSVVNNRTTNYTNVNVSNNLNSGLINDIAQPFITTDNLRNAPEILSNANGNVLFNLSYADGMIFFEEYKAMEQDLIRFNDFILRFGYRYERMGKISNFDNIRKYWNYIEFDVEVDNVPISNVERERLRKRLRTVRFWNTDLVDYNYNNYENKLDVE